MGSLSAGASAGAAALTQRRAAAGPLLAEPWDSLISSLNQLVDHLSPNGDNLPVLKAYLPGTSLVLVPVCWHRPLRLRFQIVLIQRRGIEERYTSAQPLPLDAFLSSEVSRPPSLCCCGPALLPHGGALGGASGSRGGWRAPGRRPRPGPDLGEQAVIRWPGVHQGGRDRGPDGAPGSQVWGALQCPACSRPAAVLGSLSLCLVSHQFLDTPFPGGKGEQVQSQFPP